MTTNSDREILRARCDKIDEIWREYHDESEAIIALYEAEIAAAKERRDEKLRAIPDLPPMDFGVTYTDHEGRPCTLPSETH